MVKKFGQKRIEKNNMIHVLQHKDITELNIPVKDAYKWVQQTLIEKGNTVLPPKISMVPFNSDFYNIMPSVIPYLNVEGCKSSHKIQ